MIILTRNTHGQLDEMFHDTEFMVCSVGDFAYLETDKTDISDTLYEVESYGCNIIGALADLPDEEMKDLMFLLGRMLRNNLYITEYTNLCLDLRNA